MPVVPRTDCLARPDGYLRPPAGNTERAQVDGKFFTRKSQRFHVHGVTYGPFAPGAQFEPFPDRDRVRTDFAAMREGAINAIRTYHLPPGWLLDLADEQGMQVFVDVPWRKHVCFMESVQAQREARQAVRAAAERGRSHSCLFAYSIGNEIPPDTVRWSGRRRVERFLRELMDVAKQADPGCLVTYASYPPTEYLDLYFLDFATFNVYLHDRETFRRYLFRLQNLVGDRPLVLGELGMDTLRHGDTAQAEFLAGHTREARLMGVAGSFVFSWTDEWVTGGHAIHDWAFGITRADRTPKPSYLALRELAEERLADLLPDVPRVSVVVCTYNGGSTLDQCLRSLLDLRYPDYEIIVVDDGSRDDTRNIVALYPEIRVIHQTNQGLSAARNVGLYAATGAIVAYTDSDCFVDPDWLTRLVYQLERSGAAAVGGPNLTPDDGWLAACVGACPGQPTHVLESDQVAEHIPGCNMAFRRDVLLAINGFDRLYRQAGDDVDLCWRLQQAGMWITFAPGAFVWHHRRQGPRAYLRQQAGYGRAEALLQLKHPDKFNNRGNGKWRGVLYGPCSRGLQMAQPIIYRSTFGAGFFQCLYQPGPAHWATLAVTLEWHAFAGLLALWAVARDKPILYIVAGTMLGLSLLVAALQAVQARLTPQYDGLLSRFLIACFCYVQPLVRSWRRYRTHLLAPARPDAPLALRDEYPQPLPVTGRLVLSYWTEEGHERTELLGRVLAYLDELRWGTVIDTGWTEWDLQLYCHAWTTLQVCTTQENHGSGKQLIRVRYRQGLRTHSKLLLAVAILSAGIALVTASWLPAAISAVVLAFLVAVWWHGTYAASPVVNAFDLMARRLHLLRCNDGSGSARSQRRGENVVRPAHPDSIASVLRAFKEGDPVASESAAAVAPIPSFVLAAVKQAGSEKNE
jgi:GT2 family glycosyltransferase